jgi:hypothetical protein
MRREGESKAVAMAGVVDLGGRWWVSGALA